MNFADMYAWWNQAALDNPTTAILSSDSNWDRRRFFATGTAWLEESRAFAAMAGVTLAGDRALDFGCGIGRMTTALAKHYREVVGIDISDEMIRLATEFSPCANTRFVQVKEPPLPCLDREFDCVYSTIVVQHIPIPYNLQYLGEFFRVSRNLVLVDAPSHLCDGQPPGPGIFLLDLRYALICAAQNGFDLIALREFPATPTRQYQYLFRRAEQPRKIMPEPTEGAELNDLTAKRKELEVELARLRCVLSAVRMSRAWRARSLLRKVLGRPPSKADA